MRSPAKVVYNSLRQVIENARLARGGGTWMRWMTTFALALGLAAAGTVTAAPEGEEPTPDPGLWDAVVSMYERARAAGEQVPKDVYAWARTDLENIGDWEYLVVDVDSTAGEAIQARLTVLGEERWECIWVQPIGNTTRFILKRPARSWLKQLPLSQLSKLMTSGVVGDGE